MVLVNTNGDKRNLSNPEEIEFFKKEGWVEEKAPVKKEKSDK